MFFIYPYKKGSRSVRALKDAIGGRIIKLENSRFRPGPRKTVINWGNSSTPSWLETTQNILNSPSRVAVASDKLRTFNALSNAGVSTVPFTESHATAMQWLSYGSAVFARTKLNGHSGDGIVVVRPYNDDNSEILSMSRRLEEIGYEEIADVLRGEVITPEIPRAPLYTKGIINTGEYRVHVFNGEVILYQKKSRRVDDDGNVITAEGEAADVRNLESNWVYRTGNLRRLERVEELAVNAIQALGLNFGAIDIIKDHNSDVHVLEINTAPGLGNTQTLEAWSSAFNNLVEL